MKINDEAKIALYKEYQLKRKDLSILEKTYKHLCLTLQSENISSDVQKMFESMIQLLTKQIDELLDEEDNILTVFYMSTKNGDRYIEY